MGWPGSPGRSRWSRARSTASPWIATCRRSPCRSIGFGLLGLASLARGRALLARLGLVSVVVSPSLYAHGFMVALAALLELRAIALWTALAFTAAPLNPAWFGALAIVVLGWFAPGLKRSASSESELEFGTLVAPAWTSDRALAGRSGRRISATQGWVVVNGLALPTVMGPRGVCRIATTVNVADWPLPQPGIGTLPWAALVTTRVGWENGGNV